MEEIRKLQFPVFARGVVPKPGGKDKPFSINGPIMFGGVNLSANDIVVADEEGIVIVPQSLADEVLSKAKNRAMKDQTTALDDWEAEHKSKIFSILESKQIGF